MIVRPMIGSWQVPRIERIWSSEARRLGRLPVPGLSGDLHQDLGRGSLTVEILGSLTGDEARDGFLAELRRAFYAGEPVDFVADILHEARLEQVLLAAFEVEEVAGAPDSFRYRLVLREHTEPPKPPSSFAAGGALQAVAAEIQVEVGLGLDLLDLPALLPDVALPAIGDLLAPMRKAGDDLKEVLSVPDPPPDPKKPGPASALAPLGEILTNAPPPEPPPEPPQPPIKLSKKLDSQLDSATLSSDLKTALKDSGQALLDLDLPTGLDQLETVAAQAAAADPRGTGAALERAFQAVEDLVAKLPVPTAALAPLTGPLELLEAATAQQTPVRQQISTLSDTLEQEMAAPGGSGFAGRIARLVQALREAPEGQALGTLLTTWLQAGGVSPNAARFPLEDLAAGLQGAVEALGGLMSLETLLAEGERLATILAGRLDPAAVDQRLDDLLTALDAVKTADSGAAVLHLAEARAQVDALGSDVAADMGFGEATLLYLDLPRLQIEVRRAAATVSAADTEAIVRALEALADRLLALAGLSIEGVAERRFDELLDDLEARSAQLADAIAQAPGSLLTAPIKDAVDRLQTVNQRLDEAITQAVVAARAALEEVRDAVAALPIEAVATVLRSLLAQVAEALADLRALVADVKAEISTAAGTAKEAVTKAETALATFRTEVEKRLDDAAEYVTGLKLDEVIGQVEDEVRAVADRIAAFQMKPYIDTAVTTIDDAAAVIEKVPFDLLPASMQDEVDALVEPLRKLKAEDLDQFKPKWDEIEKALEDAVTKVQDLYDELIVTVRKHDPRAFAAGIDAALADLAVKVRAIAPRAALEPVSKALEALREAVASIDVGQKLADLQKEFDKLVDAVEGYSPAALVTPLKQRVDAARQRLKDELRIAEWSAALTQLAQRAESFLALLDPQRAEEEIAAAWEEARRLLETLPELLPAGGFGAVVTALLTGTGLRVNPIAFEVVVRWIGGGAGAGRAELGERTGRLAQAIARARQAVEKVDPQGMLARLLPRLQEIRSAVEASPEGKAALDELEAAAQRALGSLTNNRKRYLAALAAAVGAAELLRQASFSEVDSGVLRLRVAIDPLRILWQVLVRLLARAGVRGLEEGLTGVLRGVLDAAPPERIARILAPILQAVHARLSTAVEGVRSELDRGVQELIELIDQLDLAPLEQALGAVHLEIRGQVEALSPNSLLGGVAQEATALQTDLLTLDPLADLEAVLQELRDGAARLLAQIDAGGLLDKPIAAWDEILATFGELDLQELLAPVLDSLAGLREEAEDGFDRAVAAFERLQEALPPAA